MSETLIFLGAGFSHAAGLPLTRELFETNDPPPSFSKRAEKIHMEVMAAWKAWKARHPSEGAEQWLLEIWNNRPFTPLGTSWENAILFALGRLVVLPSGSGTPYYHGITTSVHSEVHQRFWQNFLEPRFAVRSVITTNYDLLAEQGMREDYSDHRSAPLCHYGGFPYTQFVRKMTDRRTGAHEKVELGHRIALYKLHGSVNWADEPHGFKVHDDCRAAFRTDPSRGQVAIVPPLPEKDRPNWLTKVWEYAENALGAAQNWIVCGYSLQDYDGAIRQMIATSASRVRGALRVWIIDPYSEQVKERWSRVCPGSTRFFCLPGLPEALSPSYWNEFDVL